MSCIYWIHMDIVNMYNKCCMLEVKIDVHIFTSISKRKYLGSVLKYDTSK